MSANIKEMDSAIRSINERPSWHGLEEVCDLPITSKEQMPKIACPIVVEPVELPDGYVFSGTNCTHRVVAKHPSNSIVIASCSPDYVAIGNSFIFDKAMEAFEKHGIRAELAFALTMGNLSRVSYSFRLLDHKEFFVHGQDLHELLMNFIGGHDKTMGQRVFGSTVRVVCANTAQLAIRSKKYVMDATYYHNKTGFLNFDELPAQIEATLHHAAAFSKLAEQMGNRAIKMHEAKAIAAELLANGTNEISSQVYNAADEIGILYKNGLGNKGENLYDVWNGITQYFTTGNGSGKSVTKFKKAVSADYGNAADKKSMALVKLQTDEGELISDEMIDMLIKRGNHLLNNYESEKGAKVLAVA